MATCGIGRTEGSNTCLFDSETQILINLLNKFFKFNPPLKTLNDLKDKTKCDDDKCVIDFVLLKLKGTEFEPVLLRIRDLAFRIDGPNAVDALLDNFIIFRIARQMIYNHNITLSKGSPIYGFGGVLTLDFNIPPVISRWSDPRVVTEAFKRRNLRMLTFVFNTDHRNGQGLHWVAISIDVTIGQLHYFDSYGEPPPGGATIGTKTSQLPTGKFISIFPDWLAAVVHEFNKQPRGNPMRLTWGTTRHQESRDQSHCGVYCLYYINARINGKTPEEIDSKVIDFKTIQSIRSMIYKPTENYSYPLPPNFSTIGVIIM